MNKFCKLVPYDLLSTLKPVSALVWPDGHIEKFVLMIIYSENHAEICELFNNN